jgi:hypothetical protein
MEQEITVEDQVIDIVRRIPSCDLEEIMRQCVNLTWNQVFFAVDRLSRSGEIRLAPRDGGSYSLTIPQRQERRPDRHSFPS